MKYKDIGLLFNKSKSVFLKYSQQNNINNKPIPIIQNKKPSIIVQYFVMSTLTVVNLLNSFGRFNKNKWFNMKQRSRYFESLVLTVSQHNQFNMVVYFITTCVSES